MFAFFKKKMQNKTTVRGREENQPTHDSLQWPWVQELSLRHTGLKATAITSIPTLLPNYKLRQDIKTESGAQLLESAHWTYFEFFSERLCVLLVLGACGLHSAVQFSYFGLSWCQPRQGVDHIFVEAHHAIEGFFQVILARIRSTWEKQR